MPPPVKRTTAMIAKCIQFGFTGGVFLSLLVLVDYLIVGKSLFDRFGPLVNLWTVMALYLGGGIAAGVIAGLLHPLWRWMIGAWFVGTIAALPFTVAMTTLTDNFTPWSDSDTIITIICATILGGGTGMHMYWKHYRPNKK